MQQTARTRIRSTDRTLQRAKGLRGFTLIELMLALGIVAILALIAYPSFQQQVRQGRRADGQTALMRVAIAQEQFRSSCPEYASHIGIPKRCAASGQRHGLGLSDLSAERHYRLSIASAGSGGFVAVASAQGDQRQDQAAGVACGVLSIDQDGNRTPEDCW